MSTSPFAARLRLRRAASGLTQRELAERSGVKQPLIAALERGTRQPTDAVRSALDAALPVRPSDLLRVARSQVADLVFASGATEALVFGSTASGTDGPGSDLDLLITFPPDADIVTLLTLEERLSDLLTVPVDVVSSASSGPLVDRARREAVPL